MEGVSHMVPMQNIQEAVRNKNKQKFTKYITLKEESDGIKKAERTFKREFAVEAVKTQEQNQQVIKPRDIIKEGLKKSTMVQEDEIEVE